MTSIYTQSSGPDAWKRYLAKPDLQWVTGYSARTLAYCWEASRGLPIEISDLLRPAVGETELLLAIPEHKVPLPGGRRESQCDVFALIRSPTQLIACAVEGKVDEPFGPTLGEWLSTPSPGRLERLRFIQEALGLTGELDGSVRYQLLHRTASAVVEARRFHAQSAAMIVHSFSPARRWFEDFAAFVGLYGVTAELGAPLTINLPEGRPLYLGWASGDQQYRAL